MNKGNLSVLLIDDHEVVRCGCRYLLEQGGHTVVGETSNGTQGLELYRELAPDVLIVDLVLSGISGLEITQQILAREAEASIVIFTVLNNVALAARAIKLGALGYVTKASASSVLLNAVNQVANQKEFLGPDIAQTLALNQIHQQESSFAGLTPREFEVFRLAAQGLGSPAISETLHLSPKTVANYLYRIKQKIDVTTSAEMAHLAIRHGLLTQ